MPELITSRQNARVKEAVKLRAARQRAKQRRFLIDGVREIQRALAFGIEPLEVFVCPELCTTLAAKQIVEQISQSTAVVSPVTAEVFEKLCFGERIEGVLVVAQTPDRSLNRLSLPPSPLVAVLAGLEKPGNVGAILRTADGAGLDAAIIADGQTDLFNPNTIRASLGTVFAPHVCAATTAEVLAKLSEWQLPIIAARPDAATLYTAADYRRGAAIVLGNEAAGLSTAWQQKEIQTVQLPMRGIADSLNVSATAAVLCYEAQRQRQADA
ncbi:MAG: hypothetical protein KDA57_06000 [Planctomycetales bacterium]|nr:hypothetical protein [Planctomycetales bacterium]